MQGMDYYGGPQLALNMAKLPVPKMNPLAMNGDQPKAPTYTPGYNPNTMSQLPAYMQMQAASAGPLNALRDEAMRPGQGHWAALAKMNNAAQATDAREKAVGEAAGQTAAAKTNLAAQGGLSSGARERAEEAGVKSELGMSQGVARQQMQGNLGVDMQDEQNRLQALGQVPGLEEQHVNDWAKVRSQDIGNIVSENQRRMDFNQTQYGQQMNAWAANKQADATKNSGKGGK